MENMEALGGFANYPAVDLARKARASVRSARRWRAAGRAPAVVMAWLELTHSGHLGTLCKDWEGWHVRDGELHHPNGWHFTPAELAAIPLRYQEAAELRRQLSAALARLAALRLDYAALREPITLFNPAASRAPLSHDALPFSLRVSVSLPSLLAQRLPAPALALSPPG
jgi:hypothetical protein